MLLKMLKTSSISFRNLNLTKLEHMLYITFFCNRETGLIVQSVEKDGRVDRNGWLSVDDTIIEINGTSLLYISFSRFVFDNHLSPGYIMNMN